MISRKGLIHHLDSLEHHAGIFARTASELAHDSAQNSKAVILKSFDFLNRGSLSPALEPIAEMVDGPISRPDPIDEKYCRYCEEFFPLTNNGLAAWHETGRCTRKTLDVIIRLLGDDQYPARVDRFFDVLHGETIPAKALEGYRVHEVFSDSIGRLVVTYKK